MKKSLFTYAMLAVSSSASAQQLSRSVTASTGSGVVLNKTIIQYTIGEVVVSTLQNSSLLLTQGFQQPEVAGNNAIPEPILVTGFMVFPNPANSQTKLEFDLLEDTQVNIQLVNNAGQTLRNVAITMLAGKVSYPLSLTGFAPGLYYVVVKAGNRNYSEKLVIQ